MRQIEKLLPLIDGISNWTGKIISWALWGIMATVLIDILFRVLGRPVIWSHEVIYYLFGISFLLAGTYTMLRRGHVRVDILYEKLSPRGRAIMDLFTCPLFFLFIGGMLWGGTINALNSTRALEKFSTPWAPPLYILKIAVAVGAFLLLLQGLAQFVRDLKAAVGK